jgi:hypothetical protein
LTDEHKNKRLQWAIGNKNTNWNNIIFSDEASIWKGLNGTKIWTDGNKADIERTVKHPLKKHIWGCISKSGKKSCFVFEVIFGIHRLILELIFLVQI